MRTTSVLLLNHYPADVFAPDARARLQSGEVLIWEVQEINLQRPASMRSPMSPSNAGWRSAWPGFPAVECTVFGMGAETQGQAPATRAGEWSSASCTNRADVRGAPRREIPRTCHGARRNIAQPTPTAAASCVPGRMVMRCATRMGRHFLLAGDTWLAASTWRLPWKGMHTHVKLCAGGRHQLRGGRRLAQKPGLQLDLFHRGVPQLGGRLARRHLRQQRWRLPAQCVGKVRILGAERDKISTADGATTTAKDMDDERATGPSRCSPTARGSPTSIDQPAIFASLDRKCATSRIRASCHFLKPSGGITRRRGSAISTSTSHYAAFVQYLIARYGAYNLVFSGIHLDRIPKDFSLTADEFNPALT